MKIALINSVFEKGSTGSIVRELSKLIRKNDMECRVFFGYGKSKYPYATKISSNLYVKLNILKTRFLGKHSFYSKFATRKLIKKLNEFDPDIIHIQQVHGHYLNIPILFNYFAALDKPIFWTLHDCWAITGHCAHFDYINCNKWIDGCYDCEQLNTYPISRIFDRSSESWRDKKKYFTLPRNMTILTPSNWLKSKIEKSYLKKFSIITINNGIDLNVFKPTDVGKNTEHIFSENKLAILGMYNKWFDPRIADLTKEFIKKIPKNCIVIIIGGTKLQNDHLPEGLIGIPHVESSHKMAEYFTLADVFINFTLEDTFPTVNIEALACGTPIITFKSGGSPEIVSEEVGVVVEKFDFVTIIELIDSMQKKDKVFSSEKCRERAKKHYNQLECYKEYIKMYKKTSH